MNSPLFDVQEIGTILEMRKVIAKVKGLPNCAYGQPLTFANGEKGMVIGFDKETVDAILFSDTSKLKSGDRVVARTESLKMPVGDGFIGRVVNGLAEPCDGKEAVKPDDYLPVFATACGIMERGPLTRQMATGTKVLDAIIPIAKGQRELIIGDRVTGKTTLAVDAIINQKNKNVVCIYCCVGRSYNFLLKLAQLLEERKAMEYTVIVSSTSDAPPGEQYIAPYTAACIGEYFMRQGRDVLVVFDDLTKHAWTYRQIALLMDRSPGREAYPGDIFYVHSQLMERAAQLSPENGGGSMTFLPIVETQQGDVTGYISSNLISMTDGQIYMNNDLFQEGFKPAVDLGLSVSRIGNKIQCPAMRALCGTLRLDYVQYKELLRVTKMRSVVSKEAQAKLARGHAVSEVLKQAKNEPIDIVEQICLFHALRQGFLDELSQTSMTAFKKMIFPYILEQHPNFLGRLNETLTLTDPLKTELDRIMNEFFTESAAFKKEIVISGEKKS